MISREELRFSVFLVHALAEAWRTSPARAYRILADSTALDKYVLPCFDVLHSLGKEALVEDMTEFVREKGVAV